MTHPLAAAAYAAFAGDAATRPARTLRGGAALDIYDTPPAFDAVLDFETDAYLEAFAFHGLPHLDAVSWRHYLPKLIDFTLRRPDEKAMVLEGLLWSLRPPDREPPRLASLSPAQEAAVVAWLEHVALVESRPESGFAMQVMQEWWIPGALYRP